MGMATAGSVIRPIPANPTNASVYAMGMPSRRSRNNPPMPHKPTTNGSMMFLYDSDLLEIAPCRELISDTASSMASTTAATDSRK